MTQSKNVLAGALGIFLFHLTRAVCGQLVLSEILIDPVGVNTGRQVVEVRNLGDSEVNMASSGYWLYFPPSRWQFPPGTRIAAGDTMVIHINRPGTATPNEFFTGISGMRNLKLQGDSLSLFSTSLFGDPTQIVDFVQWGGAGNGAEDVAAAAGIWTAGAFVDIGAVRDGASVAYDGEGSAPTDWCADGTPTIGAPNDGCSTPYAKSPVIIHEIGYQRTAPGIYHLVVELKNTGSVLEDLGGKWIALGGDQNSYQIPLGTPDTLIGPGELVLVHLGVNGSNGPGNFYSGVGTFRDLKQTDSLSFHSQKPLNDPTTVIDFVEWGAAGAPFEAAAVGAGAWTAGEFLISSDRRARGSIASLDAGSGVARWRIDNTGTIGAENDVSPQAPVVLNEVLIDPTGAGAGKQEIELKNVLQGEPVDVGGYTICTESATVPATRRCYTIPANVTIQAGAFLVIGLNKTALASPSRIYTGPFQELDPAGDTLLLFATPNAASPDNLLDFIRWGAGADLGLDVAVSVGIWPEGGSIGVAELRDGSSIAYDGDGDTPDDYRVDRTPSMGKENIEVGGEEPFRRGDCNDDRKVDISDAVSLLNFLFAGGKGSLCPDACDANDDESLDISDPVYDLNFLFAGGPAPPDPSPTDCAAEEEPGTLRCGSYLSCP